MAPFRHEDGSALTCSPDGAPVRLTVTGNMTVSGGGSIDVHAAAPIPKTRLVDGFGATGEKNDVAAAEITANDLCDPAISNLPARFSTTRWRSRGHQLIEHAGVDGAASVTTSLGITLSIRSARVKNRRAARGVRRAESSTSMTCPCWSTAR